MGWMGANVVVSIGLKIEEVGGSNADSRLWMICWSGLVGREMALLALRLLLSSPHLTSAKAVKQLAKLRTKTMKRNARVPMILSSSL